MIQQSPLTPTQFKVWEKFESCALATVDDQGMRSTLFGINDESQGVHVYDSRAGALFGFVFAGVVMVETLTNMASPAARSAARDFRVEAWEWFETPSGGTLKTAPGTRAVVIQRHEYLGLRAHGGPVEWAGRLRYIDGCSDSVLAPPPLKGDPCLNLLHFPPGTDQTMHHHPSVRCGICVRGHGECESLVATREGPKPMTYDLTPGVIWCIPRGALHKFRTVGDSSLQVIAYHPDSDHGPEHESHPMINRTLGPRDREGHGGLTRGP